VARPRAVQGRIRAVDPDALWRIALLRGLGHSEQEISRRLSQTGAEISQEVVSYHLRRLRRLTPKPEDEYRILAGVMIASSTAIPYLMSAIVERAKRRGRRKE
jgi:hypothetical protein